MVFGGKTINNNNNVINIPKPEGMSGTIAFMLLTMFVVGLLIAGVVYLIKLAQQCLESQGYYEPFASQQQQQPPQQEKEVQDLVSKAKQVNMQLDESIDVFTETVQETCEVYKQVEDIYVENNSGPTSESEYKLPQDKLDKLLARRRESSKKRFKDAKTIFGQQKGTVYECFANESSVSSLEEDLRMELIMLNQTFFKLLNGDVSKKYSSINSLQEFNSKYLTKTTRDMAKEKEKVVEGYEAPNNNASVNEAAKKKSKDEEFLEKLQSDFQKLSGKELYNRARSDIAQAENAIKAIKDQNYKTKKQMELVEQMKETTDRLSEGNITSGDVA